MFPFGMWLRVLIVCCLLTKAPALAFFVASGTEEPPAGEEVVDALNRIVQVLETRERHTTLYERVALLEETLSKKTETEVRLEAELMELRAKIPALEHEIETIPEMKKSQAEFEAKIEKLVQDYEAKLSTLASEVIRLKKNGARRKDLLTLSDGTDVLLRQEPPCPEVGLGMVAERVGERCLYFYFASQLNWTSAHRHCQQLGGDLAAPENLEPLKAFLHQDFVRGPSLWLGASYNLDGEEVALDPSASPYIELADSLPEEKRVGLLPVPDAESDLELSGNSLEEIGGDSGSSSAENAAVASESPRDALLDGFHGDVLLEEGSRNVFLGDEAGSIRRILDQAAMIEEDGDSGSSLSVPRTLSRRRENALNKLNGREATGGGLKERIRDAAVIDFILLSDPVEYAAPPAEGLGDQNLPEYSNLEERSVLQGNSTAADVLAEDVNGTSSEESFEGTAVGDEGPEDPETRESKEAKKATMKCMLLQQKESRGYELIGRPCDETHNFVCDMKFAFDDFLRE